MHNTHLYFPIVFIFSTYSTHAMILSYVTPYTFDDSQKKDMQKHIDSWVEVANIHSYNTGLATIFRAMGNCGIDDITQDAQAIWDANLIIHQLLDKPAPLYNAIPWLEKIKKIKMPGSEQLATYLTTAVERIMLMQIFMRYVQPFKLPSQDLLEFFIGRQEGWQERFKRVLLSNEDLNVKTYLSLFKSLLLAEGYLTLLRN